ncbi:LexA family protein [Faecalibacterium duncaniae]|uniref:LexA family protein n=1 Tax=Faecalibacterium duncaniae (strain DSM 17677 / JCM 31915 / A2-165) TaxID=411483 RepID=UPI002EB28435|nr:XRE family transcriptional regulator [Faecalibacterium sp.]
MIQLSIAENIKRIRLEHGLSQSELGKIAGVSDKAVSTWELGLKTPRMGAVEKMANYFGITKSAIVDDAPMTSLQKPVVPPGFMPMPEMVQVPLIGSIACGTPITAEQNIKSYVGVPAAWRADFALECHGDSMAPTICDGDVVCIRSQPEVEQGQIAAVRIGEEATLKHCYYQNGVVQLIADNPSVCPPMVYTGSDLDEIEVEGLAVGFCRGLV